MGGIYKKIPITYAMMWIGSLALAGFPPFAGYYSKDVILEAAFMSHANFSDLAYWLGLLAAFLTAFYSWRLLFLVFHGQSRASKEVLDHAHESPKNMLIPLYLLAFGSVFAGYFGYKYLNIVAVDNNFFIDSIFVAKNNINLLEEIHHAPILVKLSPLLVGIVAIALSYIFYIKKTDLPQKLSQKLSIFYKISFNKWYFDEIYDLILVKPTKKIGDILWRFIDVKIIDRFGPNGFADFCKIMSSRVVKLQTGFLFHYATWMVIGSIVVISFLLFALKDLINL